MNAQALTIKHRHFETLIRELFEHQVLLLSQWAEGISLPECQYWNLVRVLDSSRRRISRRLREESPEKMHGDYRGVHHPAFQTFLTQLRNQPESQNRADTSRGSSGM